MSETVKPQREKGRPSEPRTLMAFSEPAILQFTCSSVEDAENLYRDIRMCLPRSWFYWE